MHDHDLRGILFTNTYHFIYQHLESRSSLNYWWPSRSEEGYYPIVQFHQPDGFNEMQELYLPYVVAEPREPLIPSLITMKERKVLVRDFMLRICEPQTPHAKMHWHVGENFECATLGMHDALSAEGQHMRRGLKFCIHYQTPGALRESEIASCTSIDTYQVALALVWDEIPFLRVVGVLTLAYYEGHQSHLLILVNNVWHHMMRLMVENYASDMDPSTMRFEFTPETYMEERQRRREMHARMMAALRDGCSNAVKVDATFRGQHYTIHTHTTPDFM